MTVLRVRLVALGFLALVIVALALPPLVFGYTFLAGDRATAQVTGCHRRPKSGLDCSGHWQDTRGRRGSGHISGVGGSDVGHSVAVRIGPLGPYAGGPARSWPMFLTAVPLLTAPPIVVTMMRRLRGPGRAIARRLLAEPPGDATLLSVPVTWVRGAAGVTATDGTPLMSLAATGAPPGFRPAELPGRLPRQSAKSAFSAAAGLARSVTTFAAASDPGGAPLFAIERRGLGAYEPETWLLDTGGIPQAVVRRVAWFPPAFELLGAGGDRLGTIRTAEGARSGAFVARDPDGRQVAVMAAYDRRWVLRVERDTPPRLRDLTLTFLFDADRLHA